MLHSLSVLAGLWMDKSDLFEYLLITREGERKKNKKKKTKKKLGREEESE